MNYLGDFKEDAIVYLAWNSSDGSGASITRSTNGTIQVFKDDGTAESVAGITDTEDFDTLTGVHMAKIDTSADAFYAPGHDYFVVLEAATIDGQTVNAVLGSFSIENRFTQGVPKKNIAHGDIAFYLVQDTDHVTPATGKTVTVERSLDGGATFAATTGTVAEAENGLYYFDATAADMNGDVVVFKFTATGADPRLVTIKTQ